MSGSVLLKFNFLQRQLFVKAPILVSYLIRSVKNTPQCHKSTKSDLYCLVFLKYNSIYSKKIVHFSTIEDAWSRYFRGMTDAHDVVPVPGVGTTTHIRCGAVGTRVLFKAEHLSPPLGRWPAITAFFRSSEPSLYNIPVLFWKPS